MQLGLMGVESAARSVQLSCDYPFEMDQQRGLEKMQRRLRELENKAGSSNRQGPPRSPAPVMPPVAQGPSAPPPSATDTTSSPYRDGVTQQTITRTENGGEVVVLDDWSRWAVGTGQASQVKSWGAVQVVVRGPRRIGNFAFYDLVNVEDHEEVAVRFLGSDRP